MSSNKYLRESAKMIGAVADGRTKMIAKKALDTMAVASAQHLWLPVFCFAAKQNTSSLFGEFGGTNMWLHWKS